MRALKYPSYDSRIQHICVYFTDDDVFSGETSMDREIVLWQLDTLNHDRSRPLMGTVVKYIGHLFLDKFIIHEVIYMEGNLEIPYSRGKEHSKFLIQLSPRLLDLIEHCISHYLSAYIV